MARIADIERRLVHWARWREGERDALGYAGGSVWNGESSGSGYREARVPVIDCEAAITDLAVRDLDSTHRAAVEAVYLRQGTMEASAASQLCSVATLYARVDRAHSAIASWFTNRLQRRREEVARVEHLQRVRAA